MFKRQANVSKDDVFEKTAILTIFGIREQRFAYELVIGEINFTTFTQLFYTSFCIVHEYD